MTLLYGGIIAVWIGLCVLVYAAVIVGGRADRYTETDGGDDE